MNNSTGINDYTNPTNKLMQFVYEVYAKFTSPLPVSSSDVVGSGITVGDGSLPPSTIVFYANEKLAELEAEANWNYMRTLYALPTVSTGDSKLTIPDSIVQSVSNFATKQSEELNFRDSNDAVVASYPFVSIQSLSDMDEPAVALVGGNLLLFSKPLPDKLDGATPEIYGFRHFIRLDANTPDVMSDILPNTLLVYAVAAQAVEVNPAWGYRYPYVVADYTNLLKNLISQDQDTRRTTVLSHKSSLRRWVA